MKLFCANCVRKHGGVMEGQAQAVCIYKGKTLCTECVLKEKDIEINDISVNFLETILKLAKR